MSETKPFRANWFFRATAALGFVFALSVWLYYISNTTGSPDQGTAYVERFGAEIIYGQAILLVCLGVAGMFWEEYQEKQSRPPHEIPKENQAIPLESQESE